MRIYKLAYNFTAVKSSPRVVKVIATSYEFAESQLIHSLWWDCIEPQEVIVNLVGVAPIK